MKKLHFLVLKSYLGHLIMAFAIAFFMLLLQKVWLYIDDLVGKGLEIKIIFEFLFYISASFVRIALILAILISSIMTMGDLGENYELIAVKSSGISLFKVIRPLIIFNILLCVFSFYFVFIYKFPVIIHSFFLYL